MFIMRKLTENDFDDIKEISKNIWDGTDYLPKVFHEWVYDKGYFLGAIDTETNKVIAVGKLSYLNDGSGWLEGLRVHINYRGKKIGKLITEELITLAKEALQRKEISKIAFATHSSNIESLTMMQKKISKLEEKK